MVDVVGAFATAGRRMAPEVVVLPLESEAPARAIALVFRPASQRRTDLELLADMLRLEPPPTPG
ncbi:MAG: hypothetical protein U1E42_06445 [Rhodospirillales bacterium]